MTDYQYTGFTERVYPQIYIPGEGVLVAKPGDVRAFEAPPNDGQWLPVPVAERPAKKPAANAREETK